MVERSMNKLTIKSCPVCGSTQLERALTCVDHYASGEVFHLCRCQNCGFLLTQDFPVEAEIGRYYETPDYISHSDTRKGAMNSVYHWVRSYMLKRKARLVMHEAHRREGRLLDIGTGTGYFADTMRRQGWQVEAVEKNERARKFAKEHFNLDVKPDTALSDYEPASFDVITLWHVMEHLEHLNETWERLYSLLTEKGVLIVAVPNCSSYDAQSTVPIGLLTMCPVICGILRLPRFISWLPIMVLSWPKDILCLLMLSMCRCLPRNICVIRVHFCVECLRVRWRGSVRWSERSGAVR